MMSNAPDSMDSIFAYYEGNYPTSGHWRCKFTGKICGDDCKKCIIPLVMKEDAIKKIKEATQ